MHHIADGISTLFVAGRHSVFVDGQVVDTASEITVDTIDGLIYADGILDIGHEVVGDTVDVEGTDVVESVTVIVGTNSTGNLHLIVTRLQALDGLIHIGDTALPALCSSQFLTFDFCLQNSYARSIVPSFSTLEEVGIDHQVGHLGAGDITTVDSIQQPLVHALTFLGKLFVGHLHVLPDILVRAIGVLFAGLQEFCQVIGEVVAIFTFEVLMSFQVSLGVFTDGLISLVSLDACIHLAHIHIDGIQGNGQVNIIGTCIQSFQFALQIITSALVSHSLSELVIASLGSIDGFHQRGFVIDAVVTATDVGHHTALTVEIRNFVIANTLVPYRLLELASVETPCQFTCGNDIHVEGIGHDVLLFLNPPVVFTLWSCSYEVGNKVLAFIYFRDRPAVGKCTIAAHPTGDNAILLGTSNGGGHTAVVHNDSASATHAASVNTTGIGSINSCYRAANHTVLHLNSSGP